MCPDERDRRVDVVEGRDDDLVLHALRDAGRIRHAAGEVAGLLGRQRHQAPVAHAVIAALELQDLVAAPEGACHPHGIEVGLRAARHEAHLLGAGQRIDDLGRQSDAGLVVGEEGGAERHLLQHRLDHLGMGVADEHRAGAEQEIDILPARHVPDAPAPAFPDDDVAGKVAEGAGRQHPLGQFHQLARAIRPAAIRHLAHSRSISRSGSP